MIQRHDNAPPGDTHEAAGHAATVDTAADRCVKCALCLPVCPTWTLSRNEAESPRGRIALLQGVARDAIDAQSASPHVDRCLNCMACQKVCPASVPFSALVDAGQAMLRERGARQPFRARVAARTLASPVALRALAFACRVARHVPGASRLSPTLHRVLPMPDAEPIPVTLPPLSATGERGIVALLAGCVTDAFEQQTTLALGALLNAVGYGVQIVGGCCGALSRHGGNAAHASALAGALAGRVAAVEAVAVVHPATGCAAALVDVARHVSTDAARQLGAKLVDAADWLDRAGLSERLAATPRRVTRVALHAPCTQRNVTGGSGATRALVSALPGVTCTSLTATSCCGAAGSNMLDEPQTADALAARTLAPLANGEPVDVLLTPNVGCAWHLRGFRARRGQPLRVMHPALFLAARLHADRSLV